MISQIDGKAPADNDEHLIGRGMVVPAVHFVEYCEPKAALIDSADNHIPISLGDGRAFDGKIDNL